MSFLGRQTKEDRCWAQGYLGEISIIRDYIRPKRPLRLSRATVRFETAPGQQRQGDWGVQQVGWDAFIDVRGNRYSVPAALTGQRVTIRITLHGELRVFAGEQLVATHRLQPATAGWSRQPDHLAPLWDAIRVEQRSLGVYEEVSTWN